MSSPIRYELKITKTAGRWLSKNKRRWNYRVEFSRSSKRRTPLIRLYPETEELKSPISCPQEYLILSVTWNAVKGKFSKVVPIFVVKSFLYPLLTLAKKKEAEIGKTDKILVYRGKISPDFILAFGEFVSNWDFPKKVSWLEKIRNESSK